MNVDGKVSAKVLEKAAKIKVLLMDCDGVLTGGDIVYDSNGLEIKHFNAHDGLGIKLAAAGGLKTGIISMRESGTIRKRAAEIGIEFLYLGSMNKRRGFHDLVEKLGLEPEAFCFVGDDLPDIPVMREVGLAVGVQNAVPLVKSNAAYVTAKRGGDGAIREVVELILDAKGQFDAAVQKIWDAEK